MSALNLTTSHSTTSWFRIWSTTVKSFELGRLFIPLWPFHVLPTQLPEEWFLLWHSTLFSPASSEIQRLSSILAVTPLFSTVPPSTCLGTLLLTVPGRQPLSHSPADFSHQGLSQGGMRLTPWLVEVSTSVSFLWEMLKRFMYPLKTPCSFPSVYSRLCV